MESIYQFIIMAPASPQLCHDATCLFFILWTSFFMVLLWEAYRSSSTIPWKAALGGLVLFSGVLRWTFSTGGPGDEQLNLSAAFTSGLDIVWGHAPVALFQVLGAALGGLEDTDIIRVNLVLSSLLPLLFYAILGELGLSKGAGFAAACVAALHPFLILFSGVLNRQPAYLMAASGSVLGLLAFMNRGGWHRALLFVVGTILAATTRPEGAHVLVVHGAILLVAQITGAGPVRRRTVAAVFFLCLAMLSAVYVGCLAQRRPEAHMVLPEWWRPELVFKTFLFRPSFTPAAWIALWAWGLLVGWRRPVARIALLTLGGLDFVWRLTGIYAFPLQDAVTNTRYQSILILPFVAGIAVAFEEILKSAPVARRPTMAALALSSLVTFPWSYRTLLRPFDVDHAYRFLREHLPRLPDGAVVYFFVPDDNSYVDGDVRESRFIRGAAKTETLEGANCAAIAATLPGEAYLYLGTPCHEGWSSRWGVEAGVTTNCSALTPYLKDEAAIWEDVPARFIARGELEGRSFRIGLYRMKAPPPCPTLFPADRPRVPSHFTP